MSQYDELRAQLLGLQVRSATLAVNEAMMHARVLRDEAEPDSRDRAAFRGAADELEQVACSMQKVRACLGLR